MIKENAKEEKIAAEIHFSPCGRRKPLSARGPGGYEPHPG
jgi:hypothetical protein